MIDEITLPRFIVKQVFETFEEVAQWESDGDSSHPASKAIALLQAALEQPVAQCLDECLNEWLDKTQWVQTSAQSHELGMHRADVISQRFAEITKQRDELLVALKWMIDVTDEGGFPSGMCLQKARAVLDKATGDTK